MTLTQEELNAILARNPHLRISSNTSKQKNKSNKGALASMLSKTAYSQSSKYWNYKVFIQERGISVQKKDPALGRVIEAFDSIKEYQRNTELHILEKSGKISSLERQVPLLIQEGFEYDGSKISPITYKADFMYRDENGNTCVEDVKGYDENTGHYRTTKDFDLKWKLLKFRYPNYKFIIV